MKTLKTLCTRRIIIPRDITRMQEELVLFVIWYNQYRPHSAFLKEQNKCKPMGPKTPQEVYDSFRMREIPNAPPDCHNCELPQRKIDISYLEGRRHLPIIDIKVVNSKQETA